MSSAFIKNVKISLQKKSDAYEVTVLDNKLLSYNKEIINHETEEIILQIEPHV